MNFEHNRFVYVNFYQVDPMIEMTKTTLRCGLYLLL